MQCFPPHPAEFDLILQFSRVMHPLASPASWVADSRSARHSSRLGAFRSMGHMLARPLFSVQRWGGVTWACGKESGLALCAQTCLGSDAPRLTFTPSDFLFTWPQCSELSHRNTQAALRIWSSFLHRLHVPECIWGLIEETKKATLQNLTFRNAD